MAAGSAWTNAASEAPPQRLGTGAARQQDAALFPGEEALLGQQEAQLQRAGEPDRYAQGKGWRLAGGSTGAAEKGFRAAKLRLGAMGESTWARAERA